MPSHNGPLKVDFLSLAIYDPAFGKIYEKNEGFVDFRDPETLQQLTKSILKREFDLTLEVPGDRLCPPVPIRYEYIRWIQSLIDTTADDYKDECDPAKTIVGLDVGVGASCIYPLLGCACRPSWRFGGCEIDEKNLRYASRNAELNGLQNRIRLIKASTEGPLMPLKALGIHRAHFVMCNPPFYSSKEEMHESSFSKQSSPSAVCTGAEVEMICPDGEVGFVTRMIEESLDLGGQVQWYSSMLGKMKSVDSVVEKLKDANVSNWAVTSLQAGNLTKRWAIAWSFGYLRPQNDIARGSGLHRDILPFPTELPIRNLTADDSLVAGSINEALKGLELEWDWDPASSTGLCMAEKNVWSRAARRQKARGGVSDDPRFTKDAADPEAECAVGMRITQCKGHGQVLVRWLQGRDNVLFESFHGMLKRELSKRCPARSETD